MGINWDTLRVLLPFAQFKKCEELPWRSVILLKASACNFTKSNTLSWVFFAFFKSFQWYQIAQSITIFHCQFNFPKWRHMVEAYWLIKCQACHHIETSQLICRANRLAGFCMMATLAFSELRPDGALLRKELRDED